MYLLFLHHSLEDVSFNQQDGTVGQFSGDPSKALVQKQGSQDGRLGQWFPWLLCDGDLIPSSISSLGLGKVPGKSNIGLLNSRSYALVGFSSIFFLKVHPLCSRKLRVTGLPGDPSPSQEETEVGGSFEASEKHEFPGFVFSLPFGLSKLEAWPSSRFVKLPSE